VCLPTSLSVLVRGGLGGRAGGRRSRLVLVRSAFLGVANVFALVRLLPVSDRDKDVEIPALRHQLALLQRQLAQLGQQRVRFEPADRALLAALLHQLSRPALRGLPLPVRPDTVLRWQRDLQRRHHAAMSRPRGRPRTVCSVRVLVRLARENPGWGHRRIHGELLMLRVKLAPSTVWEILRTTGIDPAPARSATTWAGSCARNLTPCWPRTSSRPCLQRHTDARMNSIMGTVGPDLPP
jgi:hypothetical protein